MQNGGEKSFSQDVDSGMTFQQNSDSFNTFFDILVMTELALLSFHFAHLPTPRI